VRGLAALTIALAAAAAAAFAQDGTKAVPDGDDSRSSADISSVRAAYDRTNDRVAHIIRFHAGIAPSALRNEVDEHGPPGSVCVNIWTRRTPWEASPNFDVCVTPNRDASDLVASVSKLGPRGGARRRGSASAELTTKRRLAVRFDPDLIRRPRAYRWSVEATTFARGCTSRGCKDFAPRRGRSVRTELGAPAS
jgi:hypothetical protein